jgi:hypothetical protein
LRDGNAFASRFPLQGRIDIVGETDCPSLHTCILAYVCTILIFLDSHMSDWKY